MASFKPAFTVSIDPVGSGDFGAVVGDDQGQWFVLRDNGTDAQIDRHSAKGTYQDSMSLLGFGHLTGIGVLNGAVWTTCRDGVVRFRYVKGVVNAATMGGVATIVPVNTFSGTHEAQISLSPTRTNVLVRERFTHADGTPVSRFIKRAVADVLAGVDNVLGAIELPRAATDPTRVEQSFGISGNQVFAGYGQAGQLAWLEQYDLTTGLQVGPKYDVHTLGADRVSENWWEIEFAEGEHILMKRGTGSRRRLLVYKHNLDS